MKTLSEEFGRKLIGINYFSVLERHDNRTDLTSLSKCAVRHVTHNNNLAKVNTVGFPLQRYIVASEFISLRDLE